MNTPTEPQSWDRIRFYANLDDYRPVIFPPPGPYWCSGESDTYSIIVAYVPHGFTYAELLRFWPEAKDISIMQSNTTLEYSDRFPKPDWYQPAKPRQNPPKTAPGSRRDP